MSQYNFEKLGKYLDREFLSPTEAIQVLELIEDALLETEKLFILNPSLTKALQVYSRIIECINEGIPEEKKRI